MRSWSELTGLWTLIFAQQSFERIASGPEAFTGVGADRLDIVLVIVLIALVPPTLAWLVETAVHRLISAKAAWNLHAVLFGVALGVFYWQFAVRQEFPTVVRYGPALVVIIAGALLYIRTKLVQSFVELISFATPIVIVLFCVGYPTSAQLLPQNEAQPVSSAEADNPVVMVVFDEFSLDNILDQHGHIDDDLFPNFGKLADQSTWYPNARAVSSQTVLALPAIMTGLLPDANHDDPNQPPAVSANTFPNNLCSILRSAGYELRATETITQFCGTRHARLSRIHALISRAMVPGVLPPNSLLPKLDAKIAERLPEPITDFYESRDREFDEFIEQIDGTEETFHFIHSMLPHNSWMYLPDGRTYPHDPRVDPWARSEPARDFTYQQVMLQIGFVDREIGRLVDRLKQAGIWDEALVVVTADHGLNLNPPNGLIEDLTRVNTRNLTPENAGSILPIPLFVKFPDQRHGRVVRREVTSVDIVPTILEKLGIEVEGLADLDGMSLIDGRRRTSDPVVAHGGTAPVETPRYEYRAERRESRLLRQQLFGGGTFYALGSHSNLLHSKADEVDTLVPIASSADSKPIALDPEAPEVAGRFEFELKSAPKQNASIAVAVNGDIAATARPWHDRASGNWMVATMLPPDSFRAGPNSIQLFQVVKPEDRWR